MAIGDCAILRSAAVPPPLGPFRLHRCLLLPARCSFSPNRSPRVTSLLSFRRPCSYSSILESVLDGLNHFRNPKSTARASPLLGVPSNKEADKKFHKWTFEEGVLLEYRKDSGQVLLAVAERIDVKRNWIVFNQNGVTSSITPQQITYIVFGIKNFDPTQIPDFLQKAQSLLDPSLLECAWTELVEKGQAVTVEELSEILYGSAQPLESYCTHVLLSKDDIYFSRLQGKGSFAVYQARTLARIEARQRLKLAKEALEKEKKLAEEVLEKEKKLAEEAFEKELEDFVKLLFSAMASSPQSKPSKCSWTLDEKITYKIQALEAYALDVGSSDEQRNTAARILYKMGLSRTSSVALDLLIAIGYFPVHVNIDLLKLNLPVKYSDEVLSATEGILASYVDPDEMIREDLTYLKVYAIDVDEADELDDALSAMKLEDGRIKVWIHVADPSRLVEPGSIVDREALKRGTSVYLPTATYPMFPEKLAMERMSLRQGELCEVVSVSVELSLNGSIAAYNVENAIIRPTYMLTYGSASELLNLNLDEEPELRLLFQAAMLRLRWRLGQGAIDTSTITARVKVPNPDVSEPTINLYVENHTDPAVRLVTEMMLLCGEAVATFGYRHGIPLPYRGHPQSASSMPSFSHIPEGPARSSAYIKLLRAAEMEFRVPYPHGMLGLPAYVQFSSPIRRYVDMLAHYQVKAFLRGSDLPFSVAEMRDITSRITFRGRVIKRLSNSSLRYWLLEYLRRQPKSRRFEALVLRFIYDRLAELLLLEVGIQGSAEVSIGNKIGDTIYVQVDEARPRDDVLVIREV